MKFGFVTCVQLGLSCIESIYEIGGKLDLLITLNDNKSKKKSGRIYLDEVSKKYQIDLLKVNHVNDREVIDAVLKYEIDWLFIIGWSQIASEQILNAPKKGCIGMHPTLLPEGRGRAAIPWAIIKNLKITGVTMFRLDHGVDTGNIIQQQIIPISADETATSLYKKVEEAHISLIKNTFPLLLKNEVKLVKQNERKATYWEGRTPADGELTNLMTIEEADRLIRATTYPYPGAYIRFSNKKFIIWSGAPFLEKKNAIPLLLQFRNGVFEVYDFSVEEFREKI
jgi:methionyl-tRNA formyltransferase